MLDLCLALLCLVCIDVGWLCLSVLCYNLVDNFGFALLVLLCLLFAYSLFACVTVVVFGYCFGLI